MRILAVLLALMAMAGMALAQQQQTPPKPAAPPPKPAAAPAKPASKFPPPAFKITVATEGAYAPFNYLDRKGMPAGFEMELAQEACQRIKAECEFAAFKWDDLIPGLIDKKFDVIMSSMEVTAERRMAPLVKAGYLEVDSTHLRATPSGRQRLNAVLERLVA